MRKATLKHFVAANAAVFAMVAAPAVIDHFYADFGWMPVANAADDGGGGGKSAERSGGHNRPDGAGGSSKRPDAGATPPAKGKTEPWDPDSKPRWMNDGAAGGSTTSSKGGKPIWGQDGLVNPATSTSAELGRMNVARAPKSVSDKQLAEALKAIAADPTLADFYDSVAFIADPATNLDNVVRLDSPLANLAILKTLLTTKADIAVTDAEGKVVATIPYTTDALAILLGSASDKTIPITQDSVYAIFKILTQAEPSAEYNLVDIATAAETVRTNILYDHDN